MAITQRALRAKGLRASTIQERGLTTLSESAKLAADRKKAFLCHSHKDADLVKGLIVILAEAGIDLYVDWQDSSMPVSPNAETARKIQQRICDAELFIFLATGNSKASRWCPENRFRYGEIFYTARVAK